MYYYVKITAKFEKTGLVVWKWTQLPVWRHQLGIWANLGKFKKTLISARLCSGMKMQMTSFMQKETRNSKREFQLFHWLFLGIFKELWLVLKINKGIMLCVCILRRSKQNIHILFRNWFFCIETQNLADSGWFLENLGEMADSKNRWRNWVAGIIFAPIDAQYTTFIEILKYFLMNVKTSLTLADF